jgi:ribulose-phosphate 3-epimerase
MKEIFPSLAASASSNVQETMREMDSYCAGYHIDIMDGKFVPHMTNGVEWVNAIALLTDKKIWIHAMVENPSSLIDRLMVPPESIVSIHIEAKQEIKKNLIKIKEKKWTTSLAINPKTDVRECFQFLTQDVDHILIMSVEPGSSGQQFLERSIEKIKTLVAYRAAQSLSFTIAIDGGVNAQNIARMAYLGVDQFAIGSGVFAQPDPVNALKELQELMRSY